jgi:hypothetical protein
MSNEYRPVTKDSLADLNRNNRAKYSQDGSNTPAKMSEDNHTYVPTTRGPGGVCKICGGGLMAPQHTAASPLRPPANNQQQHDAAGTDDLYVVMSKRTGLRVSKPVTEKIAKSIVSELTESVPGGAFVIKKADGE